MIFEMEVDLRVLAEHPDEVVPKVDEVSLVEEVFDGAFGGDVYEDLVMGKGIRGGGLGGSHMSRSMKRVVVKMIKTMRLGQRSGASSLARGRFSRRSP
ncbi:hypothetical protein Tco_0503054 [Tanacetum coccineum]